ncbi:hypothetical protein PPYR_04562 [Photinus pyralis]|uniref:PiggyBac transposable element-derived protein 4 C-terminal zinc-ribbon domain-containing protein n=1 Tax=Photinus pyralis TaxID=7054 RepID=A0A5N4AYI0_PHOPY|nr:hypothetical protein PPYR_04562 [Photinus pyralis]
MCSETKLSITEFRRQLAYSLVKPMEPPKPPKKRVHSLTKPDGPGRKKRKPCKQCRQVLKASGLSHREVDKKVRRVVTYCADCPGEPGYCLNCFNETHK